MTPRYPSSIDLMRSEAEHGLRGGWTEIRIEHTFAPYKAPDAAHDGQRGAEGTPRVVDGRPLLSPTDVRHFSVKAALPGASVEM